MARDGFIVAVQQHVGGSTVSEPDLIERNAGVGMSPVLIGDALTDGVVWL